MEIVIAILSCVIVFIAGFIIGKRSSIEKSVGTLIIDHESVPEDDPYLFLQRVNPRTLIGKKTVTLDVVIEKFVTHE